MKLVGIGLPKTGTKTLGECFRVLGKRNASFSWDWMHKYLEEDTGYLLRVASNHDSFEDKPWCSIYRDIDRAFPGSKFILTTRVDEKVWFESLRKHRSRMHGVHGQREDLWYMDAIQYYREHNESARDYFQSRPGDFVELCWEKGDGWGQLVSFLNVDDPGVPFPKINAAPS